MRSWRRDIEVSARKSKTALFRGSIDPQYVQARSFRRALNLGYILLQTSEWPTKKKVLVLADERRVL